MESFSSEESRDQPTPKSFAKGKFAKKAQSKRVAVDKSYLSTQSRNERKKFLTAQSELFGAQGLNVSNFQDDGDTVSFEADPFLFEAQASWSDINCLDTIRSLPNKVRMLHNFNPTILLDRIESLMLLGLIVREVQTPVGVAAALAQALRSTMSSSITQEVLDKLRPYVQSTFGYDVFDAQAGEAAEMAGDARWLLSLKSLKDNWEKAQTCPGFEKVSKLISMAAALGLCDLAKFDVDIEGIRVFSIGAYKKHLKATDFVSAILDTTVYFVEGAYKSFQTGSLDPFIYTNFAAKQFDEQYFDVQEIFLHAKVGNLTKAPLRWKGKMVEITDNDFSKILDDVIELANTCHLAATASWEKNVLGSKLTTLRRMRADWQTLRVDGSLREAPFGIYLRGESAVGKSTLAAYLMRCALAAADADYSDERIISVKESDKFDSNIKSYINGFFIDDLGNTNPDFVEKSPCEKLIDIMNNMPTYANMAEAEMKGKVSIAPKVLVGTSNKKLAELARRYSMLPFSIVRRMHVHLEVRVKKEFWTSETEKTLDSKKALAKFGRSEILPDLWDIDIYRPHEARKNMLELYRDNVDITYVIRHLAHEIRDHFILQKTLIENTKNLGKKLQFCKECKLPGSICKCGEPDEVVDELAELADLVQGVGIDPDDDDEDEPVLSKQAIWDLNQSHFKPAPECFIDVDDPDDEWEPIPQNYLWDVYQKQAKWVEACPTIADVPPDTPPPSYEECMGNCPNSDECPDEDPDTPRVGPLRGAWNATSACVSKASDSMYQRTKSAAEAVKSAADKKRNFCTSYLNSIDQRNYVLLNYIPDCVFYSETFLRYVVWTHRHDFQRLDRLLTQFVRFWTLFVGAFLFTGCGYFANVFMVCTLLPVYFVHLTLVYYFKRYCEVQLANTPRFTPFLFKQMRTLDAKRICGASLAIAGLYYFVRMYRRVEVLNPQGNLCPSSATDIEKRDAEENPWANAVVNELHVSTESKTTTFADLCVKAPKSVVSVVLTKGNTVTGTNAWFCKSNVAVFPAHILKDITECKSSFAKYDVTQNGSTFRCPLSITTTRFVKGTDYAVTYVPSGGSWPDLTKFLPDAPLPTSSGMLFHRQSNGQLTQSKLHATARKNITTTAGSFQGHAYHLEFPTFNGLCGSVVVLNTRYPAIGGLHLGGFDGRKDGVSGCLLRGPLNDAIESLSKASGVLLPSSNGTMPTSLYGKQYYKGPTIHQKSPINYLPKHNTLSYFGEVDGRVSYTKSDVEPTIISDLVEEVTGVARQHGPPQFHRWKNWQASLEHSSTPSPGIEPNLVAKAVEDYLDPLVKIVQDPKLPWKRELRPLSDMETVCGRDGKRFIDKMPPNTSVGFPLGGPKKDYLTYLDPEDHPAFACPAELDESFWEEAHSMEEKYLKGERAYPVFKGCLKDEPTKLDKEKVRVFQASSLAFQLLVRKYYLPVARFLSMNPIVSECAVGINAHGPEWAELIHEHVLKYGDERILAGDYSKYDLRMPAQITLAAFSIYIALAKASGNYTPREIKIMEGIATDNVYPLSAYNGDYLMFNGTVPSGTNLTVYVNNSGNSVLHRCGYFDIMSSSVNTSIDNIAAYRDSVASTFYGDDALSSVKEGCDEFNHISYANWLKERDIVFTMPDKESTPTKYMHIDQVDFLKRKDVYIAQLGTYLGALDEESIFKSLHAVLKSKVISREDQAAQNIDGALREWFAHGPEVYEKRRQQMCEIAERANLTVLCRELQISFDERVERYKEKYPELYQEEYTHTLHLSPEDWLYPASSVKTPSEPSDG